MTRRSRDDRGATAVETAIVLPVTLALLAGVFVFGLHMAYAGIADHAARVGLRTASVRTGRTYASQTDVENKIKGLAPSSFMGNPTSVVLSSVNPGTPGQGDEVSVSVTYDVPGLVSAINLLPTKDLRDAFAGFAVITRTASGRKE